MTGETLTPEMKLIVWALVGHKGQALQKDLGLKVNPSARDSLKALKFIVEEKVDRSIYLRIEDRGWSWAAEHLLDELSPPPADVPASKAQPGQKILQSWLALVHDYLKTSGTSLGEFIGPLPERVETPVKAPKPKAPRKPAKPKTLSKTVLRKRIEDAYLAITNGRKAENVPLSKLRAELSDLDRATVDRGLLDILQSGKKVRLGQMSDNKVITKEEHDAAFAPGGEPYNLLWIQP